LAGVFVDTVETVPFRVGGRVMGHELGNSNGNGNGKPQRQTQIHFGDDKPKGGIAKSDKVCASFWAASLDAVAALWYLVLGVVWESECNSNSRSLRDDKPKGGAVFGLGRASATADPYGMTNQKAEQCLVWRWR
jgi:hypothetical protein